MVSRLPRQACRGEPASSATGPRGRCQDRTQGAGACRELRATIETGTPAFLVETLIERGVASVALDGMVGIDELLSTFDVEHMATEALLFQTGYLTIQGTEQEDGHTYHRLGYPNREVRQSLNESLLDRLTGSPSRRIEHSRRLRRLLRAANVAGLQELFHAVFAGIPYEWHTRNEMARFAGWYASVFYYRLSQAGQPTAGRKATTWRSRPRTHEDPDADHAGRVCHDRPVR